MEQSVPTSSIETPKPQNKKNVREVLNEIQERGSQDSRSNANELQMLCMPLSVSVVRLPEDVVSRISSPIKKRPRKKRTISLKLRAEAENKTVDRENEEMSEPTPKCVQSQPVPSNNCSVSRHSSQRISFYASYDYDNFSCSRLFPYTLEKKRAVPTDFAMAEKSNEPVVHSGTKNVDKPTVDDKCFVTEPSGCSRTQPFNSKTKMKTVTSEVRLEAVEKFAGEAKSILEDTDTCQRVQIYNPKLKNVKSANQDTPSASTSNSGSNFVSSVETEEVKKDMPNVESPLRKRIQKAGPKSIQNRRLRLAEQEKENKIMEFLQNSDDSFEDEVIKKAKGIEEALKEQNLTLIPSASDIHVRDLDDAMAKLSAEIKAGTLLKECCPSIDRLEESDDPLILRWRLKKLCESNRVTSIPEDDINSMNSYEEEVKQEPVGEDLELETAFEDKKQLLFQVETDLKINDDNVGNSEENPDDAVEIESTSNASSEYPKVLLIKMENLVHNYKNYVASEIENLTENYITTNMKSEVGYLPSLGSDVAQDTETSTEKSPETNARENIETSKANEETLTETSVLTDPETSQVEENIECLSPEPGALCIDEMADCNDAVSPEKILPEIIDVEGEEDEEDEIIFIEEKSTDPPPSNVFLPKTVYNPALAQLVVLITEDAVLPTVPVFTKKSQSPAWTEDEKSAKDKEEDGLSRRTCKLCSKVFATCFTLKQHSKKVHFVTTEKKEKPVLKNTKEKTTVCSVCKLECNTKENLFEHIMKHTETELQEAYLRNNKEMEGAAEKNAPKEAEAEDEDHEKQKKKGAESKDKTSVDSHEETDKTSTEEKKKKKNKTSSDGQHNSAKSKKNKTPPENGQHNAETERAASSDSASSDSGKNSKDNQTSLPKKPREKKRSKENEDQSEDSPPKKKKSGTKKKEKGNKQGDLVKWWLPKQSEKDQEQPETPTPAQSIPEKTIQSSSDVAAETPQDKSTLRILLSSENLKEKAEAELTSCKSRPVTVCPCHKHEIALLHSNDLQIEIVLLCQTCNVHFRRRDCFEIHYRTSPNCRTNRSCGSVPKLFCSVCNYAINTLPEMRQHLEHHAQIKTHNTLTFLCTICKIVFFGIGPLFYSHWHNHNKDTLFVASRYSFPKISVVPPYLTTTGFNSSKTDFLFIAEYVCRTCRVPFGSDEELRKHTCVPLKIVAPNVNRKSGVNSNTTGETSKSQFKIFCTKCKVVFTSKSDFDKHSFYAGHVPVLQPQYTCVSVTSLQSVMICNVCREVNKSMKELIEHWSSHNPVIESYSCALCGNFKEVTYEVIKSHFHTWHKTDDVYCSADYRSATFICKLCNYGFKCSSMFETHDLIHKQMPVVSPNPAPVSDSTTSEAQLSDAEKQETSNTTMPVPIISWKNNVETPLPMVRVPISNLMLQDTKVEPANPTDAMTKTTPTPSSSAITKKTVCDSTPSTSVIQNPQVTAKPDDKVTSASNEPVNNQTSVIRTVAPIAATSNDSNSNDVLLVSDESSNPGSTANNSQPFEVFLVSESEDKDVEVTAVKNVPNPKKPSTEKPFKLRVKNLSELQADASKNSLNFVTTKAAQIPPLVNSSIARPQVPGQIHNVNQPVNVYDLPRSPRNILPATRAPRVSTVTQETTSKRHKKPSNKNVFACSSCSGFTCGTVAEMHAHLVTHYNPQNLPPMIPIAHPSNSFDNRNVAKVRNFQESVHNVRSMSQMPMNHHLNMIQEPRPIQPRFHPNINGSRNVQQSCYFICDFCPTPLVLDSQKTLSMHVMSYHNFPCKMCMHRCHSLQELNKHSEERHGFLLV